jgi:hypothetical protein
MNTVFFDSQGSVEVRRKQLYRRQIFVFPPRPSSVALCEFARNMIEEACGSVDPRRAQFTMPVEKYVAFAAPLKPRFIHHPETK